MTSIEVRDISKRFGETQAVNGVSFEQVRPQPSVLFWISSSLILVPFPFLGVK